MKLIVGLILLLILLALSGGVQARNQLPEVYWEHLSATTMRVQPGWAGHDEVQAQAALNALPDTGGKVIFDGAGWVFSADSGGLKVDGYGRNIRLEGTGDTYIQWGGNPSVMSYLFNIDVGPGKVEMEGFRLYGGQSNEVFPNSGAINVISVNPFLMDKVYAHHFHHGFYNLQETQATDIRVTWADLAIYMFGRNQISNFHIAVNPGGIGVLAGPTPDNQLSDGFIGAEAIDLQGPGAIGIRIEGSGIQVDTVTFRDFESRGIYIATVDSAYNTFSNIRVYRQFSETAQVGIEDNGHNNVYSAVNMNGLEIGMLFGKLSHDNTARTGSIEATNPVIDNGTNNTIEIP